MHAKPHHTTSQHGPGAKRQQIARNGLGIYENQHNLVETARNCDASPAVTTGMPQDRFLVSKRAEAARSVGPAVRDDSVCARPVLAVPVRLMATLTTQEGQSVFTPPKFLANTRNMSY